MLLPKSKQKNTKVNPHQGRENMKNIKHFVTMAIASLIMTAACSTVDMSKQSDKFAQKKPYKKTIGAGYVTGWAYRDTIQTVAALDFDGREIILKKCNKLTKKLDKSLPEYAIGDTIYFYYPTAMEEKLDTIYANQLVKKTFKYKQEKAKN